YIVPLGCQNRLEITGYFQHPIMLTVVAKGYLSYLYIMLWRYYHFSPGFYIAILSMEYGLVRFKDNFIFFSFIKARLIGSGPIVIGIEVLDIEKHSPIIPSYILSPAINPQAFILAKSSPTIGNNGSVRVVGQNTYLRHR